MSKEIFEKVIDRAIRATEHERVMWCDAEDEHMAEVCVKDKADIEWVGEMLTEGRIETAARGFRSLDTLVRDNIVDECVDEEDYVAFEEAFGIEIRRDI